MRCGSFVVVTPLRHRWVHRDLEVRRRISVSEMFLKASSTLNLRCLFGSRVLWTPSVAIHHSGAKGPQDVLAWNDRQQL